MSEKEYLQRTEQYGVDERTRKTAYDNLVRHKSYGIGMSGKMGSGKDTLAPLVLDGLTQITSEREHQYFAEPLKDELTAIIETIGKNETPAETAKQISEVFNMDIADASILTGMLWISANKNPQPTGRTRAPDIRAGLQYLGTDIRRKQDTDYWVKKAMKKMIKALASEKIVYFTDIRFPNEVEGARNCGVYVARLEVEEPELIRRIEKRDGILADSSSFKHASETALDDYENFDLIVNNNGNINEAVYAILEDVKKGNA